MLTPHSLVEKLPDLASRPVIYDRLRKMLEDDHSSAEQVSAVINMDPALSSRLLKIVNSAFYGFPSQINTISRAITIIGTTELVNLVLSTSVVNAFNDIPKALLNIDDFWQHSLGCAIASAYIAEYLNLGGSERFFTLGLLHNIGSLVIYQTEPELAKQALMLSQFEDEVIFNAEQRIMGFDHADVGAALCEAWNLPVLITEVVRHHNSPLKSDRFSKEAAIVHVADIIVSASEDVNHSGTDTSQLNAEAWGYLGLQETILEPIAELMTKQLAELSNAIRSS